MLCYNLKCQRCCAIYQLMVNRKIGKPVFGRFFYGSKISAQCCVLSALDSVNDTLIHTNYIDISIKFYSPNQTAETSNSNRYKRCKLC
jgi:hypothetical protein